MSALITPIIGADYPKKVIPLLNNAKKNVDLIFYDWRWYGNQPAHAVQQFNIALVRAVRRGVSVRALLNNPDLLPLLNSVGIKARTVRDKRTLHAKLILIDDETLVIGSHNLTRNGFGSNLEASIALTSRSDLARFSQFFENLYSI